ncbi:hypothetical protein SPRG_13863 [Saprolegnia parasitica CBS 223.65]|uniref:Uncharacterized protein n=1 Tax=Saprolegnia parasitica (strain CBS 223.65) TaxID=695850 RepID=A0A067BW48_SAPPC|nr:hypothetical protein SPRG_13863 [Saprolegnia parasitica CBS 223.65]KDO21070.1 hypothetical protein SPRG_13863 [Saprolegnia parasitica CBS 223.65]|eukprot:XP_012208249.1 hypothetical protein SPRG_13863 [Saprolegnia parasitica CBS 223.65]
MGHRVAPGPTTSDTTVVDAALLSLIRAWQPRYRLVVVAGLVYMWLSLACSVYFLSLTVPSLSSDTWWPHYNVSSYEAYLVDVVNNALVTRKAGFLDVESAAPLEATVPTPAYAQHLIFNELNTVTYAITNLRTLQASWSLRMNTQYCYVDFEKKFEIAHTRLRQARCATKYVANGAVYLEALLRNANWTAFEFAWGHYFNVAVKTSLEATRDGRLWLATTTSARETTSIDQEIAVWENANLTHFTLQWQNRWLTGISETMAIQNALGSNQEVTLKQLPRISGPWTSLTLYWIPYNTMWLMSTLNRSLVFDSANYFGANLSASMPAVSIEAWANFYPTPGNQSAVVQASIGPLPSVDTWFLAAPPSLLAFHQSFVLLLESVLADNIAFQSLYEALPITSEWTPVPSAWARDSPTYYGGNPMCASQPPTLYVQDTVNLDAPCPGNDPSPLTIASTRNALLFATVLYNASMSTTSLCAFDAASSTCSTVVSMLRQLANLIELPTALQVQRDAAILDTASVGAEIVQFATHANNGSWALLRQPLLERSSSWRFYGWLLVHDWILHQRSVVALEGDVGRVTLISTVHPSYGDVASLDRTNAVESASMGVYYLLTYFSGLQCAVGALVTVYALKTRLRVVGRNLFFFHRAVGAVWIGRPFLLLRSMVAIAILSTSQTALHTNARPRFQFAPRSYVATLVLAGDTTWLLYIVLGMTMVHTTYEASVYGPIGSLLAWLGTVLLEVAAPIRTMTRLQRQCSSVNMDFALVCHSGTVYIGNTIRLLELVGVQVLAALAAVAITSRTRQYRRHASSPIVVAGAADAYFRPPSTHEWSMDPASCAMTGLLTLTLRGVAYTFDIKLWLLLQDTRSSTHQRSLRPHRTGITDACAPALTAAAGPGSWAAHGFWAVAGLCFVLGSVVTSVSYMQLANVNLANDLWWATFSLTGAHALYANWLNQQLLLGLTSQVTDLTREDILWPSLFPDASAMIGSSASYGARLQYTQLTVIQDAIQGLRATNGCDAPWIFTAYCYVDVHQRWEMAASAARQRRCATMTTNGAVYLELTLRNIDMSAFLRCWGDAFGTAITNELEQSTEGLAWLEQTLQVGSPPFHVVADEIAYWRRFNMSHYTPQWQNFKRIGITNHYRIMNAFGVLYPFTLQTQPSVYRIPAQTSFKMYWGLANDLVRDKNATTSLLRSSPHYRYANASMESHLISHQTLTTPFNAVFSLVRSLLGPFGTIDVYFVPVPQDVLSIVRSIAAIGRATIATDQTLQAAFFGFATSSAVHPVPAAWLQTRFLNAYGGSFLCSELAQSGDNRVVAGIVNLASFSLVCSSNGIYTQVQPNREYMVLSAILSGITSEANLNLSAICAQDATNAAGCLLYLDQTIRFTRRLLPRVPPALVTRATSLVSALDIQLIQFVANAPSDPLSLLAANIMDPDDTSFHFFGWWFLCDWVLGQRDVLRFTGDVGSLTVLSEYNEPLQQPVAQWQSPRAIASYARSGVLYVSGVLVAVAIGVVLYIIKSRGQFEGGNVFEINRVGAVVWVGRPMLLLRSMTAIALLSTATLELDFSGFLTRFVVPPTPVLTTLLAAGEVTWFSTIVNDVAMVYTRQYTSYYATPNACLIWLMTGTASLLRPVSHSAHIEKACGIGRMDDTVLCDSGILEIGSQSRLLLLLVTVCASSLLTYLVARYFVESPASNVVASRYLYAGARYLFVSAPWVQNETYYLDRASALPTGILTYQSSCDEIVALDVKGWRVVRLPLHTTSLPPESWLAARAQYALPLTD